MSAEVESSLQCLSRGDNLRCQPKNNVIFILWYQMSPVLTQLQYYFINYFKVRATFAMNGALSYDVAMNAATAAIGFLIQTLRTYNSHS